jgi:hypothetical protein
MHAKVAARESPSVRQLPLVIDDAKPLIPSLLTVDGIDYDVLGRIVTVLHFLKKSALQ